MRRRTWFGRVHQKAMGLHVVAVRQLMQRERDGQRARAARTGCLTAACAYDALVKRL